MRQIKLRALTNTFCEMLTREFEGYGNYSNHTWRADFDEGTVVVIRIPATELIAVGDRLSTETLSSQGRLGPYFRRVRISG